MNICSICGKPTGWQGTITLNTLTGTSTAPATFGLVPEMCVGHPGYPMVTVTTYTKVIRREMTAREPVPDAFLDAFEGDDEWTL